MSIFQKSVWLSALLGVCIVASANEYDDSWIVPKIEAVVFTPVHIGVELRPTEHDAMLPEKRSYKRFFVADRITHDFRQVEKSAFDDLMVGDHSYRRAFDYDVRNPSITVRETTNSKNQKICSVGSTTHVQVGIGEVVVEIELPCQSIISDAVVTNGEVWIAVYRWATHGAVDQAGDISVYALDGSFTKSVEVGNDIVSAIAIDPWSTDKWIVSYDGLAVFSLDDRIARRYWPIHRMDEEGPDVFVDSAENRLQSDPMAILAYSVEEEKFPMFAELIADTPEVMSEFSLYSYYMQGSNTPMAKKASSWLNYVTPTETWQQFACLLPYENAKELCRTAPEEWIR